METNWQQGILFFSEVQVSTFNYAKSHGFVRNKD